MGMRLPPELEKKVLSLADHVQAVSHPDDPPYGAADERKDEKAFMWDIIKEAKKHGWMEYHTYDSRRSRKGFPDLVLVRDTVIFAELKTDTGKLSPEQSEWLAALLKAGADARVWRPADWPAIQARLSQPIAPR